MCYVLCHFSSHLLRLTRLPQKIAYGIPFCVQIASNCVSRSLWMRNSLGVKPFLRVNFLNCLKKIITNMKRNTHLENYIKPKNTLNYKKVREEEKNVSNYK